MTHSGTDNALYRETLLRYYEEEVMGEAYFHGLAGHFDGSDEREKLALLAEDDLPALRLLTDHEVAAIDFANKELAGDPDSLTSIREFLDLRRP